MKALKAVPADQVNSVHDKWFVLSLKLTDQEAEDHRKHSTAMGDLSRFKAVKQVSGSGKLLCVFEAELVAGAAAP